VNRVGFTNPYRRGEDGRAHAAQFDRQSCALILADTWSEKIGKGLTFISLDVEAQTPEAVFIALDPRARNSRPTAFWSRRIRGATVFWWSMISTAFGSFSTNRTTVDHTN
jgi:hypothetical protein